MELSSLIYLNEAIEKGKKVKPKIRVRSVPVEEALGLYASQDIRSPKDFPPYDRSAVDGFAVSANDTISSSRLNPSIFKIVGDIAASSSSLPSLQRGEAARINTGGQYRKVRIQWL